MRIEKARREARKLGDILRKYPHSCTPDHWARLSDLRIMILKKVMEHNKRKHKPATVATAA